MDNIMSLQIETAQEKSTPHELDEPLLGRTHGM